MLTTVSNQGHVIFLSADNYIGMAYYCQLQAIVLVLSVYNENAKFSIFGCFDFLYNTKYLDMSGNINCQLSSTFELTGAH